MAAFDPHAAQIKVLEQALSFAHDVERQLRERIQRLEMRLHVADYDCNQSLVFRIYPDKKRRAADNRRSLRGRGSISPIASCPRCTSAIHSRVLVIAREALANTSTTRKR